ncbi:MAG: hypothetical protein ACFHXK_05880 [bacterium]
MRSLNVELQIHDAVPEPCSDRLLIVPRKRNSRLADLEVAGSCERIALLLDEQTEPIAADMQVTLHSWPARSSDRHVETLARHLHIGRRTLTDDDIKVGHTEYSTYGAAEAKAALRAAAQNKRAERRKNVITLTLLGVVVVTLVSLLESDPKPADEQVTAEIDTPSVVEEAQASEVLQARDAIPAPASQTPDVVILDETGAQVSHRDEASRLCSARDVQEGRAAEPCHLILF